MLATVLRLIGTLFLASEWRRLRAALTRERSGVLPTSPPLVAQCLLVSGEDRRHRWHAGYDPIAILRAVWRRVTSDRVEGASTIEQQIVRVLTGRYERTFPRKIREIILATLVAKELPKSLTPRIYLNLGYYGWRMNGFNQACRRLNLDPENLSLVQAALLVARLKYPEPRIAPIHRKAQIQRRARHLIALYCRHIYESTYAHLASGATATAIPIGRTDAPARPLIPGSAPVY